MEGENPPRTLGDYSRPSHEGYRNTIEIPDGNNVVPLRSDTIRLVQNGCSFTDFDPTIQTNILRMGALPSDTVNNPKLNVNHTTSILSARSYPMRDPHSSSNSFKLVNAIKMCFKSTPNIQKDQLQVKSLTVNEVKTPKSKEPGKGLEDEFKDLHLNLPVLKVLAHVPIYDALLDKYIESLELGKSASAFIQGKRPKKMKDPGLLIFF
ncbi:hypothetical protein Tco_0356180 [Tanacetum coccineum]